jgi:ribosomal protein S2
VIQPKKYDLANKKMRVSTRKRWCLGQQQMVATNHAINSFFLTNRWIEGFLPNRQHLANQETLDKIGTYIISHWELSAKVQ